MLVGTVAYQAYAGLLGVKLAAASIATQDVDLAQFWGISKNIGDSMPAIIETLRQVDPTFRERPDINDPIVATRYQNAQGYKVEFLTPNRGSQDHQAKPASMPALGGAGAQPLRHLDFLIHEPERSALLYAGGIPVTIPRAERYAVHELIVATGRQNQAKAAKDIVQAETLISVLATQRPHELAEAWETAWTAGPHWRKKLESGKARLSPAAQTALGNAIAAERASRAKRGEPRQS